MHPRGRGRLDDVRNAIMRGIKEFSTAEMPPGSTLAAWRGYMSEVYYKLDIVSGEERIHGSLRETSIASICDSYATGFASALAVA